MAFHINKGMVFEMLVLRSRVAYQNNSIWYNILNIEYIIEYCLNIVDTSRKPMHDTYDTMGTYMYRSIHRANINITIATIAQSRPRLPYNSTVTTFPILHPCNTPPLPFTKCQSFPQTSHQQKKAGIRSAQNRNVSLVAGFTHSAQLHTNAIERASKHTRPGQYFGSGSEHSFRLI